MGARQYEERKQRITGKTDVASERKRSGKINLSLLCNFIPGSLLIID